MYFRDPKTHTYRAKTRAPSSACAASVPCAFWTDGQIEKLVPQPQEAVAFGLLTRNEAPIRSSTKSTSEPLRNGTEAGSTSTITASRLITVSSSALLRSTLNLY